MLAEARDVSEIDVRSCQADVRSHKRLVVSSRWEYKRLCSSPLDMRGDGREKAWS